MGRPWFSVPVPRAQVIGRCWAVTLSGAGVRPYWGGRRVIGAGNGALGQVINLPQCGLTCPNGRICAHAPASRTDDGGSLPQCAFPARRAPLGASDELLLSLAR
ncbi:hypothetical protein HMPREF1317_0611 [Schaalia georgiae F0490]|uniref:Uncharacterized protein n=1 Tax=Schaalia georgiae F0490 TaxID=1125717 RepID=J0NMD7_9ACTO|nr:hypothetical protein HMPREF1317_0611 [Schaalia georgiae F0490]